MRRANSPARSIWAFMQTRRPSKARHPDRTRTHLRKHRSLLRAYADEIDANRQSTAATPPAPGSVELPDVNTMIAKLIARLEKQPNDVKGWKMLGWSYLNTDRPEEAATAYETALKLEPSDLETQESTGPGKVGAECDTPSSAV